MYIIYSSQHFSCCTEHLKGNMLSSSSDSHSSLFNIETKRFVNCTGFEINNSRSTFPPFSSVFSVTTYRFSYERTTFETFVATDTAQFSFSAKVQSHKQPYRHHLGRTANYQFLIRAVQTGLVQVNVNQQVKKALLLKIPQHRPESKKFLSVHPTCHKALSLENLLLHFRLPNWKQKIMIIYYYCQLFISIAWVF